MENVGEKIFNLRKQKGVSQEKLAEALDVARPTVSRWENNAVQPTTENIKALSAFFGVESSYFIDGQTAVIKDDVEEVAALETVEKEPKFKTLQTVFTVVGMVLLAFCIMAFGIAAYVTIAPSEGGAWSDKANVINYTGIIYLVLGTVATAIFITLLVIFIKNYSKNRKHVNCNTVSTNCNTDVTDKRLKL